MNGVVQDLAIAARDGHHVAIIGGSHFKTVNRDVVMVDVEGLGHDLAGCPERDPAARASAPRR